MAIILRALGGAVAVGLAIGPAAAAGATDLPDPKVEVSGDTTTMKFSTITTKQTFTAKDGTSAPSPTATPEPGDKFSFIEEIRQGETLIGTDSVECVTEPEDVVNCSGTFTFADGTLRAAGSGTGMQQKFAIKVLGGTGAYEGISGTGTVVNQDDTHGTVTLNFSSAKKSTQVAEVPSGGAATGGHIPVGDSAALLGLGAVLALVGTRLLAGRRH